MWFLAASAVLFGPLLLTAVLLLYRERRTGRPRSWGARLWLHPMNSSEWVWVLGGLAVVGVLTGGIGAVLGALADLSQLHLRSWLFSRSAPAGTGYPARGSRLLRLTSLGKSSSGERTCCRGKKWPSGGRLAGHWGPLALFHAAFPWQVLVTLVPITLILPYVVQREDSR